MKREIFKLGEVVVDSITELKGMLTHYQLGLSGQEFYAFQPKELHPETGLPVDSFWISKDRISKCKTCEIEDHQEIIGSEAEDTATGFKGKIICVVFHINGCAHADLAPPGKDKKTGGSLATCNFDLRRLKGKKIPMMSDFELEASRKRNPSPDGTPASPMRSVNF